MSLSFGLATSQFRTVGSPKEPRSRSNSFDSTNGNANANADPDLFTSFIIAHHQPVQPGWIDEGIKPHTTTSIDDERLTFTIFLKHSASAMKQLDDTFNSVTDPTSPQYGHYLSSSQLGEMINPPTQSVRKVMDWLNSKKKELDATIINQGDNIRIESARLNGIEQLLKCHFHLFHHPETNQYIYLIIDHLSIPSNLQNIIQLIVGLTHFPTTHRSRIHFPVHGEHNLQSMVNDKDESASISEASSKSSNFMTFRTKEQIQDAVHSLDMEQLQQQ